MASISDSDFDDKRLIARVEDAIRLTERRGFARFVGFFDERQTAMLKNHLRRSHPQLLFRFDGGHPQAERVMLGVFPDEVQQEESVFPFVAIRFDYRLQAAVTHRDVLGSVLACGIERDTIGDIVIADGYAIVFVTEELAAFVADSVDTIGREGVKATFPFVGKVPPIHRFAPLDGTVASPRLDAVLKVLIGVSREQAVEWIRSDRVRVDHVTQSSASFTVREGAIISVSGYGRFVIDDLSALSKKGRVILRARKFV